MPKEQETPETPQPSESKGGSGKKTIIIVAAVMLIEAGAIVGTMMLSGGPDPAMALEQEKLKLAEQTKLVELMIAQARFVNTLKGKVMLYDTEAYILVQNRYKEQAEKTIETKKNRIEAEIATVFARADPLVFKEPDHATIERQIKTVLTDDFGKDADDKPILQDVFIKKMIEFSTDT